MRISILLDFYGELLTQKQQEVVELYYNQDLSLAEIAEHAGITRQGVRDCIKRAEFQLLDYEDKLGLARRFSEIQQGVEEIERCAEDLREEYGKPGYPQKMEANVRRILEVAEAINPD